MQCKACLWGSGGQSASPGWIERLTQPDPCQHGALLICSNQILLFSHLESKTLKWQQAGFKGEIHTQRPAPSQGVAGCGSPFPWHLHRTSSTWSVYLSLSDPLPGTLSLGCHLLSFQKRQRRPHKYEKEFVSQDMSKHRSKAGAACLSVPFINMEWSRPWAVGRTDQGCRVRTWRYLVL